MSCLWVLAGAFSGWKDLCAVGEALKRFVGLDMAISNVAI